MSFLSPHLKRKFFLIFSSTLLIFIFLSNIFLPAQGAECAIASFTECREKSKLAEELHEQGRQFFDKHQYKEALEAWLKELELNPMSPKICNNIGIVYRRLGDLQSAVHFHKRALELDPEFGHAYYSLGLVYYDLQDFSQLEKLFVKAIEFKYYNPDVYYSLGQAQKLQGKCGKEGGAPVYSYTFEEISQLPQGTVVGITGVYEKVHGDNFFYILEAGKSLINTRDVLLECNWGSPKYLSPSGKIRVMRSPHSNIYRDDGMIRSYGLWLEVGDKTFVSLGEHNDGIICDLETPVSWSPDENYLFVERSSIVSRSNGSVLWKSKKMYSSATWDEDLLFLRGMGKDDSVYLLNLHTGKFERFLNISEGEAITVVGAHCIKR